MAKGKVYYRNNWRLYSKSTGKFTEPGEINDLSSMDQSLLDQWVEQGIITPVTKEGKELDSVAADDGADAPPEDGGGES